MSGRSAPLSVGLGMRLALGLDVGEPAARGSLESMNPLATEHVGGLPADIRRAVTARERACGNAAAAGHYFSTSTVAGGRLLRSLHFQEFACTNRAAVCNADGCLHEIYVEANRRYRPVFSTYARDLKMGSDGGALVIEVFGGRSSGSYRWNGGRFVPRSPRTRGERNRRAGDRRTA
ncbi:hypothetical protein [Bradyrhizobium sp. BTAi1]|uniref:hypothetical protein n=1 Tax=Bradyrhizobium sp. (strain BTAi1 / ATCC BAA-1182) TaxID=288000 RepID=UPI00191C19E9|nr:hypothetical protein [Bradyrhizobium sp. BTAi1]